MSMRDAERAGALEMQLRRRAVDRPTIEMDQSREQIRLAGSLQRPLVERVERLREPIGEEEVFGLRDPVVH